VTRFTADQRRITRLLIADVLATIGPGHEDAIRRTARAHAEAARDAEDLEQRVVDDIQQYFHDTFVDTTWPTCPLHPNHPLWFASGWWRCGDVAIAPLGQLGSRLRQDSRR
jgi:hypothetical protein